MITGCSHREYTNLYPHSKRIIDIDKEQCTYKAEKAVPHRTPLVHISINSKMSKKERKALEFRHKQKEQQSAMKRRQRVKKLRDLCLKAKGWRWQYIDK